MTPSIRTLAALCGKSTSTVQRWKKTNPWLYAAAIEKARRDSEKQLDAGGRVADTDSVNQRGD